MSQWEMLEAFLHYTKAESVFVEQLKLTLTQAYAAEVVFVTIHHQNVLFSCGLSLSPSFPLIAVTQKAKNM